MTNNSGGFAFSYNAYLYVGHFEEPTSLVNAIMANEIQRDCDHIIDHVGCLAAIMMFRLHVHHPINLKKFDILLPEEMELNKHNTSRFPSAACIKLRIHSEPTSTEQITCSKCDLFENIERSKDCREHVLQEELRTAKVCSYKSQKRHYMCHRIRRTASEPTYSDIIDSDHVLDDSGDSIEELHLADWSDHSKDTDYTGYFNTLAVGHDSESYTHIPSDNTIARILRERATRSLQSTCSDTNCFGKGYHVDEGLNEDNVFTGNKVCHTRKHVCQLEYNRHACMNYCQNCRHLSEDVSVLLLFATALCCMVIIIIVSWKMKCLYYLVRL